MKSRGKFFVGLLCGLSSLPILVGCGGAGESTTADATDAASAASAESGSSIARTANPASQAVVIEDGAGSQPAQCVSVFLDSLRSGDEQAANGVLTEKARQELAKTSYEMQPLGTPQGKFEIGRVGFPYEDKSVALVECIWTEPAMEEEAPVTMELVCEVHQDPVEWRIAGLAVTIPSTAETLVLDFENAAALQATIDAATGQAPQAGPATNVAAQNPNAAIAPGTAQYAPPQGSQQVPAQMVSGPQNLPSGYPAGTAYPNQGGNTQPPMQQNAPAAYPAGGVPNSPAGTYQGNQLRPSQPAGQQQVPVEGANGGGTTAAGSMPNYSGNSGSYPASGGRN